MEQSYNKNKKKISLPGFRKGHAPRKVIEKYYGEGVFYEDAINAIFPEVYEKAVEETGIEPVEYPTIDIVQIGQGEPLILTAEVAVKPEAELGQYKGIEVEKKEYNVTDEDIDKFIEAEQQRNARWVTIEDRPIKEGDRIVFDYAGFVGDEQFEGGTAERQTLDIGSGTFIPGFEDQMVGISIGEEKEISVKFPDEYHAENLKGKDAIFKVKVHEIKEKELPALDDEFAKDISEFDTLDEYKADVRDKMQKNAEARAKSEMEDSLIQKVTENANVDIPQAMVDNELDYLIRDFEYRLRYNGLDLKSYMEMTNTSENDLREQYKEEAYNRVKSRLILEKVIEVESIDATDEDLEKQYDKLAEQYGRDVEEIKKSFADRVDYLKGDIKVQKAIDL